MPEIAAGFLRVKTLYMAKQAAASNTHLSPVPK